MSGGASDHCITQYQAEVHLQKSEYAESRRIHMHTLENTSSDHNAEAYAFALLNIAKIDILIGGAAEYVYQNLQKANELFSSLNYSNEITFCEMNKAVLELREQKFDLAKFQLCKCLHSSCSTNNQVVSFCLETLANTEAWPTIELRCNWSVVYLAFAQKSKEKSALHKALLFLGDVFRSNNDEGTAHNLFTVALEGFTYMDIHLSRAQCMIRLGDLANSWGEISEATELWKAARPLFQRSLQAKDVVAIDTRLAAVESPIKPD
jgi:tetratricopeptide (TPR) repeat protein